MNSVGSRSLSRASGKLILDGGAAVCLMDGFVVHHVSSQCDDDAEWSVPGELRAEACLSVVVVCDWLCSNLYMFRPLHRSLTHRFLITRGLGITGRAQTLATEASRITSFDSG